MNFEEQFDRILRYEKEVDMEDIFISSGADLLDIIMGGGYGPVGKIVNIIGDSSTFKTYGACEVIYQAKKIFKDKLKIRYNDCESGFNFNTTELYGYSMEPYLVATPSIEVMSADLQHFCKGIKTDKGELGIYVVDSFDGLASDEDLTEFEERLKLHEKGKTYDKGSYDMSKQKFSSKMFRTMSQIVKESNVLLIIISQIRDKIGVSFGANYSISGGKALKFYSTVRLFLQNVDFHEIEGRKLGATVKFTGMKVRSRYPYRDIFINVLFEHGVDNVSTNIDYLFDLRDDRGKLKLPEVTNNIKWKDNSIPVSSVTLKEFLEEKGKYEEAISYIDTVSNGRKSQKNYLEFIQQDQELASLYVDYFGVIDRESLITHAISNDLEDDISKRTIEKWLAVEDRIKPIRKKKSLEE